MKIEIQTMVAMNSNSTLPIQRHAVTAGKHDNKITSEVAIGLANRRLILLDDFISMTRIIT